MGAANPGVTVTSRGEEVGDSQSLGLPGATFSKRGLCGLGGPEASDSAAKEARPPTVAILANRKNIIWKCFTYRHNLPNVQFYFNAAGASRWPTDVLNPSFYEHEDPPLPVGYQLPPNPRNVQELFSGFPPRVGHGLVSGDGSSR